MFSAAGGGWGGGNARNLRLVEDVGTRVFEKEGGLIAMLVRAYKLTIRVYEFFREQIVAWFFLVFCCSGLNDGKIYIYILL